MSIATVVTRGYGSFGTIPFVVTRGYSIGVFVVVTPGADARVFLQGENTHLVLEGETRNLRLLPDNRKLT